MKNHLDVISYIIKLKRDSSSLSLCMQAHQQMTEDAEKARQLFRVCALSHCHCLLSIDSFTTAIACQYKQKQKQQQQQQQQ